MKPDTPDTKRARAREAWREKFLVALAKTGVVKDACKIAGVGRSTVYEHRASDEAFAAAWDVAEADAADVLELEAVRRAVEGVDEPVFHQGEQIATVRKYSDRLLEFLLRARRPEKFRENVKHDHAGSVGLTLSKLAELAGDDDPDL